MKPQQKCRIKSMCDSFLPNVIWGRSAHNFHHFVWNAETHFGDMEAVSARSCFRHTKLVRRKIHELRNERTCNQRAIPGMGPPQTKGLCLSKTAFSRWEFDVRRKFDKSFFQKLFQRTTIHYGAPTRVKKVAAIFLQWPSRSRTAKILWNFFEVNPQTAVYTYMCNWGVSSNPAVNCRVLFQCDEHSWHVQSGCLVDISGRIVSETARSHTTWTKVKWNTNSEHEHTCLALGQSCQFS